MAADKKISELNEYTISDLDNINGSLYVPVVSPTTMVNYKVDLSKIIQGIISKITAITPYDSQTEGSELIDEATIQTVVNNINSLRDRVSVLESEQWPEHTLVLTDGTTEMEYLLKTCRSGSNTRTVINTTKVTKPNFYVTLEASNPTISGTTATVKATFTAQNFHLNLQLEGGLVGVVKVSGSLTLVSLNTTLTATLNEQSIDLSSNSSFTLTKGINKSHNIDINLTCTIPLNAVIQGVTLVGSVDDIRIVGQAIYSVSLGSFPGVGYITLPSNGS